MERITKADIQLIVQAMLEEEGVTVDDLVDEQVLNDTRPAGERNPHELEFLRAVRGPQSED